MSYTVEKLDDFGRGIINVDNKICFVKNALPTEEININITKEKKKYLEANVENYLKESHNRIAAKCKYYGICGGCQLEHMKLEDENQYKKRKVEDILEKFASQKIKIAKINSGREYNYRNKITLHVQEGKLCLLKEDSNDYVEIDKCLLVDEKINVVISKLMTLVTLEKGIKTIMIRIGNYTDQIMIDISGEVNNENVFLPLADSVIINNKNIKNNEITSTILDYQYYVSNKSFFQVNKEVVEMLYSKIISVVKDKKAKKVLDLYCGVGTISLSISKYVNSVIGVEVVEDAIKNANKNKELNKIKNVEFICGKAEDIITRQKFDCDTIIVDPPRKGIDKRAIDVLNNSSAKNIIYVSCDPITLARDINRLNNYEVMEVELFNMFPRTYHVECVSVLHRKSFEK